VWTAIVSVADTAKKFAEHFETWASSYFDNANWTIPFDSDLSRLIITSLQGLPSQTLVTSTEGVNIRLVEFDGIKLGWIESLIRTSNNDYSSTSVYVETNKLPIQEIKQKLGDLIWKRFGNESLVMYAQRVYQNDHSTGTNICVEIDKNFPPLPSKQATEYSAYLAPFIANNIPRSVMFYGPPGTGKSTMARTIVDSLKLNSFRIRVDDLSSINYTTLFEALSIFRPDVLILDDFDRCDNQSSLLELVERFQQIIKLTIATINHRNSLDEALLRPGRFDELVYVKHLDECAIKNVLGPKNIDAFELVREWPIAFIQEYVKRRMFMEPEKAEASIMELAERVDRLSKFDNENFFESWNNIIKNKKSSDKKTGVLDDEELWPGEGPKDNPTWRKEKSPLVHRFHEYK